MCIRGHLICCSFSEKFSPDSDHSRRVSTGKRIIQIVHQLEQALDIRLDRHAGSREFRLRQEMRVDAELDFQMRIVLALELGTETD